MTAARRPCAADAPPSQKQDLPPRAGTRARNRTIGTLKSGEKIESVVDDAAEQSSRPAAPDSKAAPYGTLLALGVELDKRIADEREAFARRGPDGDDRMSAFTNRTDEVVERIGVVSATTIPEAAVKARAMVWAAFGDDKGPPGLRDLSERLMITLCADLAAMTAGSETLTPLRKLAAEMRDVAAEVTRAEAETQEKQIENDARWVAADRRHQQIVIEASGIDVASYAELRALAQIMFETLPKGHGGGLWKGIDVPEQALACLVEAVLSLDPSLCAGLRRHDDDQAVVVAKRLADAVKQSQEVDELRLKSGLGRTVASFAEAAASGRHSMGRYEDALEAMLSYTPASSVLGVAAHLCYANRSLGWVIDAIDTYTRSEEVNARDRDRSQQDALAVRRHLYFAMHAVQMLLGTDASEVGTDRHFGDIEDPLVSPEMMGAEPYVQYLLKRQATFEALSERRPHVQAAD